MKLHIRVSRMAMFPPWRIMPASPPHVGSNLETPLFDPSGLVTIWSHLVALIVSHLTTHDFRTSVESEEEFHGLQRCTEGSYGILQEVIWGLSRGQMRSSHGSCGVIHRTIWGHPGGHMGPWGHPRGHLGSSRASCWGPSRGHLGLSGAVILT